jgi:hypothetical protein
MADEKEVLATLLRALQQRSDEEEDKDLKTLFREVRDELRVLNGNTKEDVAARKERQQIEEMTRKYPALRQKMAGSSGSQYGSPRG